MTVALKEKDQKLALAATEFWSGIFQVVYVNNQNEQHVVQMIGGRLPKLCPLLFECCKFTEYDRELLPDH